MAGTLTGSIEHYITSTGSTSKPARDIFASIANFFDGHAQMTRIASQKGTGSGGVPVAYAGTGALGGYSDEANYSGENAFGVWRWDKTNGDKVYILVQHSGWGSSIGSSPGNPGVGQGSYGVGIQYAMDSSGGNPWNGGTANAGADAKNGTNVWVPNGGTLLVWPRANGPGGSGATIRQYMMSMGDYTSPTRFSLLMDDDQIAMVCDTSDNGDYNYMHYFGPYTARSGLTAGAGAYVCLSQNSSVVQWNTDYGTLTGVSNWEGGAVLTTANQVRTLRCAGLSYADSTDQQPNRLVPGYDIIDAFVRMQDATSPSQYGFFGKIDPNFLAFVYNTFPLATNSTKTRCVFGTTTKAAIKWLLPWDGATIPGSGLSQTGVQF